jgi:hypothetical protein
VPWQALISTAMKAHRAGTTALQYGLVHWRWNGRESGRVLGNGGGEVAESLPSISKCEMSLDVRSAGTLPL